MKKLILLTAIAFNMIYSCYSQSNSSSHTGFYFRAGLGPVFGHLDYVDKDASTGTEQYKGEIKGTGVAFNLNIGGALKENHILTFDIISRSISSPQVSVNGAEYTTNDKLSVSEVTYGAGYTYYIMPVNIYVGATLGGGTIVTNNDGTSTRSKFGFSTAINAGKTWWIGRHGWGLGLNGSYGFTKTNTTTNNVDETIKSSRFFITALVSFN